MGVSYYSAPLVVMQGDGAALGNTLTPTSLLLGQGKFTMPANTIDFVGKKLRVTAAGRVSNIVTTPGTLTLDLRFGSVIVANGGAMPLNIVAKTNVAWELQWDITARTVGSTTVATLMHQGLWMSESAVGAVAGTMGTIGLPASAPAVGTGFDSTAAQQIDLFGTWSIANAGNTITCHQFMVELLN
jgi:hypothetical protein